MACTLLSTSDAKYKIDIGGDMSIDKFAIRVLQGVLFVSALPAHAALLSLNTALPDLQSDSLALAYDAAGNNLTLSESSAGNYFITLDGNSFNTLSDVSFSLTATIDQAGALSGGNFAITGQSTALGIPATTTLLSGAVSGFGYQDGGPVDLFEFEITNLAGELAGLYGSTALVHATTEFGGTFNNSFSADFSAAAYSDTFAVVPVPAAIWLLGSGLIGLAGIARRRPHKGPQS